MKKNILLLSAGLLASLSGHLMADFISLDEALDRARQTLGNDQDVLDFTEEELTNMAAMTDDMVIEESIVMQAIEDIGEAFGIQTTQQTPENKPAAHAATPGEPVQPAEQEIAVDAHIILPSPQEVDPSITQAIDEAFAHELAQQEPAPQQAIEAQITAEHASQSIETTPQEAIPAEIIEEQQPAAPTASVVQEAMPTVQDVPNLVPALEAPEKVDAPKSLSPKQIKHRVIPVNQQKGLMCGNHAACNALAVQTLFLEDKKIEDTEVQNLNRRYIKKWNILHRKAAKQSPKMKKKNLEVWDMLPIAEQMGLKNAYVVKFNRKARTFEPAGVSSDVNQEMNDRFALLKNTDQDIVHVICNTGAHWISASIVKNPDKLPVIYYMDSLNVPTGSNKTGRFFIQYLKKTIAG